MASAIIGRLAAASRCTPTRRRRASSCSADVLAAIDEAVGDVVVEGPQLAAFVREGVKHR